MATPEPHPTSPKAFISYSWDDDAHKEWVRQLAIRLRKDGVDVTLDRWDSEPGDQIPAFMERAVRENDFVIAVCTPQFKEKSDERGHGVGYEGDIMTAYALRGGDKKKFIPVLRRGNWDDVAPTWLLGRAYIDLSSDPYSEPAYKDLLRTMYGAREKAPPVGPRPDFEGENGPQAGSASAPVTPVEPSTPQHESSATPGQSKGKQPMKAKLETKRSENFQAVPLYTPEDKVVFAYFERNLNELDAMAGRALNLIIPEAVLKGDVDKVYKMVESPLYEGLKRTDLPCLWIEGPNKKHFTLPLPKDNPDRIKKLISRVSALAVDSHSIGELCEKVRRAPDLPDPLEECPNGSENDGVPPDGNISIGRVVAVFVMALVAVLIYIAAVPLLKQYASGVPVIFALAMIALVPAVVFYMLAGNWAALTGKLFGLIEVRFAGSAAIWALVFISGMLNQPAADQPPVTRGIYFHLPESQNEIVPQDGKIILQLDEPKSVPITQGYASVARIPVGDGGRPANFTLALPGYELVDKNMTIELAANKLIYVPVKRSAELFDHNDRAFTCGFYFHEREDRNALVRVDGKLTLQLDEPKFVPISQGYASAANLQGSWEGWDVSYVVELPGYHVAERNAKARLRRDGRVYISVLPNEK